MFGKHGNEAVKHLFNDLTIEKHLKLRGETPQVKSNVELLLPQSEKIPNGCLSTKQQESLPGRNDS